MKSNLLTIMQALFRQQFRFDKSNKRAGKQKIGVIIAFAVLGITWGPMLIFTLINYSKIALQYNVGEYFMSIIMLGVQGMALIFGTIMLFNTLFFSKDNEFLSTLPVKSSTIFFAKMLYVVVNEFLFASSLGIITVIVYGIVAKMVIAYYLLGILASFISPLLSILVASLLMFPMMYLTTIVNKNTTTRTIISMLAFGVGMYFYMKFIGGISNTIEPTGEQAQMMADLIVKVGGFVFFNLSLAKIILLSATFMDVLTVIAVYAVGVVLVYILSSIAYRKGLERVATHSEDKVKSVGFKSTNIIKSLMLKDLKEISRDTSLAFYCLMQFLMAPLMIVLIFGVMYKNMGMDAETQQIMIYSIGVMFTYMFAGGTNYMATSSITRENRSWYIMKIMPVPYVLQVMAKLRLSYIMSVVTAVLSVVPLVFFGLSWHAGIVVLVSLLLFCYGINCLQVKRDIDKPRLNWTNIAEGLKNNSSSMISMFMSMGIGLAYAMLLLAGAKLPEVLDVSPWITSAVAYAIVLGTSVLFAIFNKNSLFRNIDTLFEKLEG